MSRRCLFPSSLESYTKGFLAGCAGSLTRAEVEMLPMGAKLMTLECGIRFLADYLMGDTYSKPLTRSTTSYVRGHRLRL